MSSLLWCNWYVPKKIGIKIFNGQKGGLGEPDFQMQADKVTFPEGINCFMLGSLWLWDRHTSKKILPWPHSVLAQDDHLPFSRALELPVAQFLHSVVLFIIHFHNKAHNNIHKAFVLAYNSSLPVLMGASSWSQLLRNLKHAIQIISLISKLHYEQFEFWKLLWILLLDIFLEMPSRQINVGN